MSEVNSPVQEAIFGLEVKGYHITDFDSVEEAEKFRRSIRTACSREKIPVRTRCPWSKPERVIINTDTGLPALKEFRDQLLKELEAGDHEKWLADRLNMLYPK